MSHQGIPALNYHAIDDTGNTFDSRNVSVTLSSFREQMNWLHTQGYQSVTKDDLRAAILNGKKPDGKYVLITFDDGYYSLYRYAADILAQYGFTATLFLSTSFIGNTYNQDDFSFVKHDRQLTWDEIKALADRGWSIQSHGVLHNRLNKLSTEAIVTELTRSKKIIEEHLGTVVDEFAYPYGIYTNNVIRQLKATGYKLAYSVHSGKIFPRARRYRLPRIEINNMDNMETFITKVSTGFISPQNARRSKLRDIIYANATMKDFIEKWTPYFGVGNH